MFRLTLYIVLAFLIVAFAAAASVAQTGADGRRMGFGHQHEEDLPKNVRETKEKMRIEKAKKDYDDMLERGEEAAKIAERVERSYAAKGSLSGTDISSIESVEKSVKKIRSDLGGDDDDEKVDDILGGEKPAIGDAVTTLKNTTSTLFAELKKMSRFSISAAAIESSNAAIKIARFLRLGK